MKQRLDRIIGFSIETSDGLKGKVKDFIFDEEDWIVRYLEVDFGNFFKDNRVLIPAGLIELPLWKDHLISLKLSKEAIEKAPKPEDRITVSREYEIRLSEFYGYQGYWSSGYMAPAHPGVQFPLRPIGVPTKRISEKDLNTTLRSFREIEGYHIIASDGKFGHVEDMIVDDVDWQLIYLIIDTSNWKPWSKKVIMSINWLDEISYELKEATVNLHSDIIKNAPEFDTDKSFEEAFEKVLSDYYEK